MLINADGSVTIEAHDQLTAGFLKKWKQDVDNPAIFRLRWPDCSRRELQVLKLPCGKRTTNYTCQLKGINVSPSICDECSEK